MVIQVGKTSVDIGLLSLDNDEEEDRKSGKLVILSTSC